ncbi:MAG: ATP-grasp domain-containing protein [Bacteroidetes bacterium]|nr:ATP-grasp domain-containing protein [Bacteroidota bacterium]
MKREEEYCNTDGETEDNKAQECHHEVAHRYLKTKADTYAEWDTEETILAVKAALEEHHKVTLIEADESAYLHLRDLRPDIVFNIAEGIAGVSREAQIPAMLEMLQIPYTGSDPLTLALCLDKARTKEILSYYHIPTPKFYVAHSSHCVNVQSLNFPLIVKPLYEGSSKGIFNSSVVWSIEELEEQIEFIIAEYHQPALVEEFLEGREFTVALLGNLPSVKILPIIELKFDSLPPNANPLYSYEAKWVWDTVENPIDVHECPANIEEKLRNQIEEVCRRSFEILRCRDWCRIDVRLDSNGIPNVLEVNPLPGILPNPEEHSCFPLAARTAGIDYNSMINSVLNEALMRYGLR